MSEARDHEARAEEIARGMTENCLRVCCLIAEHARHTDPDDWWVHVAALHTDHTTINPLLEAGCIERFYWTPRTPSVRIKPLGLAVAKHWKGKTDE